MLGLPRRRRGRRLPAAHLAVPLPTGRPPPLPRPVAAQISRQRVRPGASLVATRSASADPIAHSFSTVLLLIWTCDVDIQHAPRGHASGARRSCKEICWHPYDCHLHHLQGGDALPLLPGPPAGLAGEHDAGRRARAAADPAGAASHHGCRLQWQGALTCRIVKSFSAIDLISYCVFTWRGTPVRPVRPASEL